VPVFVSGDQVTFLLTALLSAALTALGIVLLLKSPLVALFLDTTQKPHALHQAPTPRLGGLAIMLTVVLIVFFQLTPGMDSALGWMLLLTLGIAIFSMVDDRRGLPVWIRLVTHLVAASFVVILLGTKLVTNLPTLGASVMLVLFVIGIVWMTNLYNFMDGANGLAGLMGCIGFGGLAIIGATGGAVNDPQIYALVVSCAALSGACAGFLFFNFPASRVFLGDAGSIALGFLAGTATLYGVAVDVWPLWLPILCFSPFIVDATVTLFRRALRGEKIWLPHRQHFYQRLIIDCEWSHRRTALTYAMIMLLAIGDALRWYVGKFPSELTSQWLPPLSMLLAWVLIYTALLVVAEREIRRRHRINKTNMSTK
jgi:UDP-N-acetylmuramyl pentapeptide phosphotransferase/UDP-N-acetylglucosamine-1-phosphate transferase